MRTTTVMRWCAPAVCAAVLVGACGGDDAGPEAATVTVVDGTGQEVSLPTDPQRVFGMYTTDLDYALALGLPVAPTQAIRDGSVGLPAFFPQDDVEHLEFFVNYPEYNFEKIAFGWYNADGSGGFYGPQTDNLAPLVFHDLGIATTAAATDVWTEVAHELIGTVADADIVMIAVETETDPQTVLDQVRADPIWSSLPAVAEDRLVAVNNELSYASPSAHLELLDVLAEALPLLP